MPDDQESEEQGRQEEEEDRRRRRDDEEGEQKADARRKEQRDRGEATDEGPADDEDRSQAVTGHSSDEVVIPQVALEEQKQVETPKVDVVAPEVESDVDRELLVPEIDIGSPDLNTATVELDDESPDVKIEGKERRVPLVQSVDTPEVRMQVSSFETAMRKSGRRRQQRVHVPLYRTTSEPRLRFVPELRWVLEEDVRRRVEQLADAQLEPSISEDGEGQEEFEEDFKKEESEAGTGSATTTAGGEAPAGGGAGEEVPDFMEFIFKSAGTAGDLQAEGTQIVLFNEADENSYVGSFVTLCRRIYREKHGGHPEFQPLNRIDEFNKREIEKWLDADRKVILIDLDEREQGINEEDLKEKLEATLGEFGFIIFKTTDPDLVDEYQDKLNRIYLESPHPPLNIVKVEPKQPGFAVERRLAELSWGNIDLQSEIDVASERSDLERAIGPGIFDDLFNRKARNRFEERLDAIKAEEDDLFKRATTKNRGQIRGKEVDDLNGESPLHFNIKVFLVRYLVQALREEEEHLTQLGEIEQEVETEEQYGGVIPDVRLTSANEVYEVETLFRAGQDPLKKIDRTIKKYEEHDVDKIHIVLENFTFLRHLKELAQMQRHHSHLTNQQGENLVEFYTLDLRNNNLLSLSETIESLRALEADNESAEYDDS